MSRALPSPAEVEHLLQQMLMNNTEQIAQATQFLIKYLKSPASVPVLFQLLQQSQHTAVRQTSAVLLRKKIVKHWNKLGRQGQEHMKRSVLEMLTKEPERIVRYSISTLISTIGRVVLPRAAGWKDLFPTLFQLANSADPTHRESALLTLEALEEHIGDLLEQHYGEFYELFKRSLSPQEAPIVQVAAIKCIGMLIPWLSDNEVAVNKFRDFIPLVVGVIQRAIGQHKEDDAVAGFEVLQELAESPSAVLEPYIMDLTNFVLQVGANRDLDFNIRSEALTVIQWIAQFKPGLFARNNLVAPIMQAAFQVASEPDEFDDVPHDEMTARKFGSQVIDCMTKYVETPLVYPVFKQLVGVLIQSHDFNQRAAAVSAMTVAVEGCVELMIPEIAGWIDYLMQAFNDPNPAVRQLACIMLGRFAEWLAPEIYEFYEKILPMIYKALMEESPAIQERACYALLSFIENLETEQSLPYMDNLMQRLVFLLQNSQHRDVQEMCISAISAVASSVGTSFTKYWEPITLLLAHMQSIVDENLIVLRSRAIECAGIVALAVGKDTFGANNINAFMQAALAGFQLQNGGDMKEYVMTFFANIAETLKTDFANFLPPVMECIANVLTSTEGVADKDALPGALGALVDDFDDGEEYQEEGVEGEEEFDDVSDDDMDDLRFTVQRSFVDEKLQALHCLGVVMVECGPAVIPWVEPMFKILNVLKNYVHHDIRKACGFPLENMMIAVYRAYPPPQPWSAGMSPETPISDQARSFIGSVFTDVIDQIQKDHDMETVSRMFDVVKTISSALGVNSIYPHMAAIGSCLVSSLRQQLISQQIDEEDEENEVVETEQLEIFCTTCDVLMEWARQLGPQYFMPFWEIVELLLPYLAHKKDGWRQEAMGALCEICNHLDNAIAPRVPVLLEPAAKCLHDPHLPTRSNAAYCVGLLAATGAINQFVPELSAIILNLLQKEEDHHMLDNCCGSYGRMITASAANMDLQNGLNVWMKFLPLRYDMDEWSPVLTAIFGLFQQNNQAVMPHIPQVVHLMTGLMATPKALEKIPEPLQQSMAALVKHLGQSFSGQLQSFVAQMSAEQQQFYMKCVNS